MKFKRCSTLLMFYFVVFLLIRSSISLYLPNSTIDTANSISHANKATSIKTTTTKSGDEKTANLETTHTTGTTIDSRAKEDLLAGVTRNVNMLLGMLLGTGIEGDKYVTGDHEVERRKLKSFDTNYQDLEIRLPDYIYSQEITVMEDGAPVVVVITVSASKLILLDIHLDKFSIQLDANFNFQQQQGQQQIDRTFYMDGFNVETYLKKSMDNELYREFNYGTLLSQKQIFPCLLNVSYDFKSPNISVAIGRIMYVHDSNPQVEAAVQGQSLVDTLASPEGIPLVAGTLVRNLAHEVIASYVTESKCPDMIGEQFYLDWRDFFLTPQESSDLGGTGLQPYGNVGQKLFSVLNGINNGEQGSSIGMNSILEFASDLSSEEKGTILIKGECYIFAAEFEPTSLSGTDIETFVQKNVENDVLEALDSDGLLVIASILNIANFTKLNVGIKEMRIRNLDTLNQPSKIFRPTNEPYTLENVWNIGTTANNTRPFSVSLRSFFDFDGYYFGPQHSYTEFDITFSADVFEVDSEIFALVSSEQLIQFPFEHFLNVNCWLALLMGPSDARVPRLKFNSLSLSVTNASLHVSCVSCQHVGIKSAASSVTAILDANSVKKTLMKRIAGHINEWVFHDSFQSLVNVIFNTTSFSCPYLQDYNTSLHQCNATQNDSMTGLIYALSGGVSDLSEEADQTLIFIGLLFTQLTLVSLSEILYEERHNHDVTTESNPISDELFLETLDLPDNATLVNWKDLDSPILSWLFGSFRNEFVSAGPSPEDVDMNRWMEEFFLKDGDLILDLESGLLSTIATSTKILNTTITLSKVRIKGLNKFSYVDLLNPVAPQKFENEFKMDTLELQFDVRVKSINLDEEIELYASFDGFSASVPIFLALDLIEFESLQVGSFLSSGNIFWCLLTAVYGIELPPSSVEVGDILDFSFRFSASDINEAIADSIDAMFNIMRPQIDYMFDYIFEVFVREVLNHFFENAIKISFCPSPPEVNFEFVDFREMLQLKKTNNSYTNALTHNSYTNAPTNLSINSSISPLSNYANEYGDLFRILKILLDTTLFLQLNDTYKEPMINQNLIRPATIIQSGEEGKLVLPVDLRRLELRGIWLMEESDLFLIHLFNLTIENADTFGLPMNIMNPNERDGELLDFEGSIGVGGRPLKISFMTLVSLEGPVGYEFRNLVQLDFEFYDIKLLFALYAKLRYRELIQQKLEHSFNPNCWALLFTTPGGPMDDPGFELDHFDLNFEQVGFNLTCVECSSYPLEKFPELIDKLNKTVDVVFRRLGDFGVSLLDGFISTGMLDTYVLEAAYKCPDEDVGLPPLRYEPEPFPPLTVESLETLAFFMYLGLQLSTDFALDLHAKSDPESFANPLRGQEKVPTEINLISFTQTEGFNPLYPFVLLNDFLRAPASNNDDRMKALLVAEYLFSNGTSNVPVSDSFSAETWRVGISDLRLTGFDTLTHFDMFKRPGPQVIQSEYGWKKIGFQFLVHASSRANNRTEEETLEFNASISLEDFNVSAAFLVALDEDKVMDMKIGDILEVDDAIPCLFEVAHSLNITQLYVTASRLFLLDVDGYRSEEIIEAIEEVNNVLGDEYMENLNVSLPALTDLTVREILNAMIRESMGSNSTCGVIRNASIAKLKEAVDDGDVKSVSYDDDLIDLRDLLLPESTARYYGGTGLAPYGQWFFHVKTLIDMALDVDDREGPSILNAVLFSGIGPTQLQKHYASPKILNIDQVLPRYSGYSVRFNAEIVDFRIDNLDTLGSPMKLFAVTPDSPYMINNIITLGAGKKPLVISFRAKLRLGIGENSTSSEFLFSASISSLSLAVQTLLKFSYKRLIEFPIEDLYNLFCWVALLPAPPLDSEGVRVDSHEPSLDFDRLAVHAEKMKFTVACIDCSEELRDIVKHFSSEEASIELTTALNTVLDRTLPSIGIPYAQNVADKFLHVAAERCPHRDEFDSINKTTKSKPYELLEDFDPLYEPLPPNAELRVLLWMVISMVSVFAFFNLYVWKTVKNRNNKWFEEVTYHVQRRLRMEEMLKIELNKETECLFRSRREIPLVVRYAFPVVLLCSVGLFITTHMREGSKLHLRLAIFDLHFGLEDTFTPPMFQFFALLWKNGPAKLARPIFVYLAFTYVKQFITFALWFTPPAYVSIHLRRWILYWLCAFAKWSMLEEMFVIVSAVGMNLSVSNSTFGDFRPNIYSFKLSINPTWGLFANLTAQMISQMSSHVALYYHNKIVERATRKFEQNHNLRPPQARGSLIEEEASRDFQLSQDAETLVNLDDLYGDTKDALCTYSFQRLHKDRMTDSLVIRSSFTMPSVNVLLILSALYLVACILLAFYYPVISFETFGVLSAIENVGIGVFSKDKYSVHTMCTSLRQNALDLSENGAYVGLMLLATVCYVTLLLVPCVLLSVLFYLWFVPMTGKRRRRLLALTEVLQTYNYCEVFLFAVVILSWKLEGWSNTLLEKICSDFSAYIGFLQHIGFMSSQNPQCLGRFVTVGLGFYVMVVSTALLYLLKMYVVNASEQYFEQRDEWDLTGSELLEIEPRKNSKPFPVRFTDKFRWTLYDDLFTCSQEEEANMGR